ncbi:chromosomal replication initiator protein DnaA [Leptothrix sp. BB-4]
MHKDLWERGCERLAAEMPEQQFNTWIKPLPPADVSDGGDRVLVGLRVPNRFKLDWIRSQYSARIETMLSELAGMPVRLELSVQQRDAQGRPASAGNSAGAMHLRAPAAAAVAAVPVRGQSSAGGDGSADARQDEASRHASSTSQASSQTSSQTAREALRPVAPAVIGARGDRPVGANGQPASTGTLPAAPVAQRGRLNPALTFDTLVPGRANQMARTAALHVVGAPGQMYNPLFIYGGVGLGKTHLIHAVGNALIRDNPDARVLYLHAEQFISDVVRNYQRKTFDELKAKYHSLDLLLIDDVQFFAGKDRTQEEFFNAFEALLAKRAHIIMTSDTYPKGLVDIDERLTSRFDAGLTVAIEPPELEMRVAILMKKAIAEGSPMPEDVAFFIAKNVRANVRELEGALRKVLAYAKFSHKDISITLAREALKDLLSIQNRQISVENIQKTVADFYKIKVADMYSKKRPVSIARPRQIAMYLAKEMTQKSLPEIGELFGGRDHTTVLHAVRKIGGERQKNTELNQQLHVLEQTLKG